VSGHPMIRKTATVNSRSCSKEYVLSIVFPCKYYGFVTMYR
jgi:hypothetical protein